MAKNYNWSNFSGKCAPEDEVDDDTFLKHPAAGSSGYMLPNSFQNHSVNSFNKNEDLEQKRQELLQRKQEIENRTLQSTQRSLSYLRNSEEVGIATAEELVRQREQLERTEQRLDDINTTLRFSQKHIQGIKSVFGGLKKMLSGSSNEQVTNNTRKPTSDTVTNSPLDGILGKVNYDNSTKENLHFPGLREDFDSPPATPTDTQSVINNHLDEMSGSITQLKVLAGKLGEEIQAHNEIIENNISKAEKVDTQLIQQNKDMKRLLK